MKKLVAGAQEGCGHCAGIFSIELSQRHCQHYPYCSTELAGGKYAPGQRLVKRSLSSTPFQNFSLSISLKTLPR